eukprot:scaffold155547_cov27-Tisochrysis_lutea.AAC.2
MLRPNSVLSILAQIERAEKQILEPIAIRKPIHEKDASDIDEMDTPPTIGSNERKMGSVTAGPSERKSTVRSIVASGSPALIVSTNEALTAPKAPLVRQKPIE